MPSLHWLTKENDLKTAAKTAYRLLVEDEKLSYGDPNSENLLVQGDNLEALKALLPFYAGQVKCIYIDPPYNTGAALEHYDDNFEHTIWISIMYPRLELLKQFLKEDGSIFIQLDDNEYAYAKVICDEIFGRDNFINQVSVRMKQTSGASGGGEDKKLKKNIEYILIYVKDLQSFNGFNEMFEEEDLFDLINSMRDEGKSWKYTRVITSLGKKEFFKEIKDGSGKPIKIYKHSEVQIKPITEIMAEENITEEECYFNYFDKIFRDTNAQSSIRTRVMEANDGHDFLSIEYYPISGRNKNKLTTLYYKGLKCDLIAWLSDVAIKNKNKIVKLEKLGTYWEGFPLNNLTKEGSVHFPKGKKPEALIKQIFELSTNQDDLILDSFLGSGTTAAVAHKIGRRYISIEMGEQAKTHCAERLKKVIDGEQSGISKTSGWKGGGGFRFFTLGDEIFDGENRIKSGITFENLAAHIYFTETKTPMKKQKKKSAFLGVHNGIAYALLYNGILGDKSERGGNVLTNKTLYIIMNEIDAVEKKNKKEFGYESLVIYGEATKKPYVSLQENNIVFKQTPYDIKVW